MKTKLRSRKVPPRVGDVFLIPVSEGLSVYGQILSAFHRTHLVVVFQATTRDVSSIDDALMTTIQLAGIVFDAKFVNGDWPVVGNRPSVTVQEPWFVSGHEAMEDLTLTNVDMSIRRRVTPAEAANHGRMVLSSPLGLEKAARALRAVADWQEEFHGGFRDLARELSGPSS
jgi:Immunity protein 26